MTCRRVLLLAVAAAAPSHRVGRKLPAQAYARVDIIRCYLPSPQPCHRTAPHPTPFERALLARCCAPNRYGRSSFRSAQKAHFPVSPPSFLPSAATHKHSLGGAWQPSRTTNPHRSASAADGAILTQKPRSKPIFTPPLPSACLTKESDARVYRAA